MLRVLYPENRKKIGIMQLRCFRNDGTMGMPLEIFFAEGGFHLHVIRPYADYLDSTYCAKSVKEAIATFKFRSTPGEKLNWDTVKYVRNIQNRRENV